jgi:hypothetical protein
MLGRGAGVRAVTLNSFVADAISCCMVELEKEVFLLDD